MLFAPISNEELYLYLSVTKQALSSVLFRDDREVHQPVYCISYVLHGVEEWYTKLEEFALAVIIIAQWMRPYFQAHLMIVLIDMPPRLAFTKLDILG